MSQVEVIQAYSHPTKSVPDVRVTVELKHNRIQTRWERVPKSGRALRQIWLRPVDSALYASAVLGATARLRQLDRPKANWALRLTRSRRAKKDAFVPGIEMSNFDLG
jgi:hypothetical protein